MVRRIQLLTPAATALLLVGMSTADKLRVDPREADAFHAAAAAVVARVPGEIGSGKNWWYAGKEIPLPDEAAGLLKPNAYLHRVYVNPATGRRVELMLVQCRDSRDMQGHYPPVCYPSNGCTLPLPGDAGDWNVDGLDVKIPGREYRVTFPGGQRLTIRNFFVLPNGKLVRDMDAVTAAAKDQRELVYGVAQVQLLYEDAVAPAERDRIFAELVGSNRSLVDVLRSGVRR